MILRLITPETTPHSIPTNPATAPIAGPNLVALRTPGYRAERGEDLSTSADFTISGGERVRVRPHLRSVAPPPPAAIDADLLRSTTPKRSGREWSARCTSDGHRRGSGNALLVDAEGADFCARLAELSLRQRPLCLSKLAARCSWDYRYCWVRDATLTLIALMGAGYYEEAIAWRNWLQRAVAGSPHDLQIMYGLSGERRLNEWESALGFRAIGDRCPFGLAMRHRTSSSLMSGEK